MSERTRVARPSSRSEYSCVVESRDNVAAQSQTVDRSKGMGRLGLGGIEGS